MLQKASDVDSSVTIDFCEQCEGIWLDSTELDQLESKNIKHKEKFMLVLRNIKTLFFKGEG